MTNQSSADIKPVAIEEEMKRSYLDYAMSVIVSRALPDVRDGLKPVHRRILFAMKDSGNDYNRPYRKSARVTGEVMGKYHPHGNMAIYDALVRLTQDFSLRLPLIDGQGNFGSMDGDPAAAERYTECRLARSAHDLLEDIDKDTVDFQPNYDDSLTEPKVLPARIPNLLVNGTNGIAVGMATNIPSHNLGEVIDAAMALVDDPTLNVLDLMKYIPGPDFPTGGSIIGRYGIHEAYTTGRGSVVMRGKTTIENFKNDREAIIINEIPYQVNKARMIERIADLVREKTIEGISDLRDESDRDGVRVVIELKRDAVADVVLNQLYRYTPLQTSFGCNMLALVHGRPMQLTLKDFLSNFIEFREEVIVKRTRYELARAREKAHTLVGFAVAISNIDPIIALIKQSKDRQTAKDGLLSTAWDASTVAPMIELVEASTDVTSIAREYYLTEVQANAILELRLHRLTGMEREKIHADLTEIVNQIQEFLSILASRQKVLDILKSELTDIRERYAMPRKTIIEDGDSHVDIESLIQKEDMVVTVSTEGYIKRVPLSTYRAQRRGGKGRSGMTTKNEDAVSDIFVANTHSVILFFSTLGRVYQMKVYRLPLGSPTSKGRAIINLLPLAKGETVSTVLVMPDADENQTNDNRYLMFVTSKGGVRRNALSDFANIRSNGLKAMKFEEDTESLIKVELCGPDDDIMLFTQSGACNRFNIDQIRVFAGRDSTGVRGIKLQDGDHVISSTIIKTDITESTDERDSYIKISNRLRGAQDIEEETTDDATDNENENFLSLTSERIGQLASREQFILTITENGYGKRSSSYQYRTTNRGTQGYDSIGVNDKIGGVVAAFPVDPTDEIMLVTDGGQLIRCPVKDIRICGRRSQGVIVFRVGKDEHVVSVSRVPGDDENEVEIDAEGVESVEVDANILDSSDNASDTTEV
jgi:DNA gyrase subunit A